LAITKCLLLKVGILRQRFKGLWGYAEVGEDVRKGAGLLFY